MNTRSPLASASSRNSFFFSRASLNRVDSPPDMRWVVYSSARIAASGFTWRCCSTLTARCPVSFAPRATCNATLALNLCLRPLIRAGSGSITTHRPSRSLGNASCWFTTLMPRHGTRSAWRSSRGSYLRQRHAVCQYAQYVLSQPVHVRKIQVLAVLNDQRVCFQIALLDIRRPFQRARVHTDFYA